MARQEDYAQPSEVSSYGVVRRETNQFQHRTCQAHLAKVRCRLRVLAYHGVGDEDVFRRQIASIAKHYVPVSLTDFFWAMSGKVELPRSAVLVTFDDGCSSIFERGLPILHHYKIPAVIFVVGHLVDSTRPFWWDEVVHCIDHRQKNWSMPHENPLGTVRWLKTLQNDERLKQISSLRDACEVPPPARRQLSRAELRELEASGIEIGNHTLTHPCLDMCDDDTIRHELRESQRILTEILGKPPRYFAYPNGNVTKRVRDLVEAEGFEAAFLFDHRVQKLPIQDPMMISRLRVDASASMFRFRLITSGIHSWLYHKFRRDERPTGPR